MTPFSAVVVRVVPVAVKVRPQRLAICFGYRLDGPWRRCGPMPSLIRLLVVLGLIGAVIYGGMVALVVLVEPRQREMSVRIPSERLQP